MARPPRSLQDAGVYHLISRGNNKKAIFEISRGCQRFKEILLLSQLKYTWRIYHYCLMPNHFHILACIENSKDLPKIMQAVLQAYSRWYRSKTTYVGYLWRGRYRSPLIQDESYLLECGRYIERNPVRANLSSSLEEYSWSSYQYYAYGKSDPLIFTNPAYEGFGSNVQERQKKYRDFARLESHHDLLLDQTLLSNLF
jgi:putative transposase